MNIEQPSSENEIRIKPDSILVSRADLKGRITYCNKDFFELSGFTEGELLGSNYNQIIHPQTPAEVLQDLWDNMNAGKPWSGIIKNRCKTGGYYWARANITPLYADNRMSEFVSVWTPVSPEEAETTESLYQAVKAQQVTLHPQGLPGLVRAIRGISLKTYVMTAVALTILVLGLTAILVAQGMPNSLIFSLLGGLAISLLLFGVFFSSHLTRSFSSVQAGLRQITEGKYFDWIGTDREDEFGYLNQLLNGARIKLGIDTLDAREKISFASHIEQALDNINTSVTVSDSSNRLIYMNRSAQALFEILALEIRQQNPSFQVDDLCGAHLADAFAHEQIREICDTPLTDVQTIPLEAWNRSLRLTLNPLHDATANYLGLVMQWVDITDELQVEREIDQIIEFAKVGELSKRVDISDKKGFFKQLGIGVNALIGVVETAFSDIALAMSQMSKGDLTKGIAREYEGEFDDVKQDVNQTIRRLEDIVSAIRKSTDMITAASAGISNGNNNLSARIDQQAQSLEETAFSMEELTRTVKNNADNAQQANRLAAGARRSAETGGEVVNQAVQAMDAINTSSSKIAEIIGVIDDIAFQTNLLALNASVEAARAGEQGRGFAVVATEVRNLAGRSATAAKEIKELIRDSVDKVKVGAELVNKSGSTLEEIVTGVKRLGDIIFEIAAASQEQSVEIDQVNHALTKIDEVTQQSATLAEETSTASASMREKAQEMGQLMGFFTVANPGGAATPDPGEQTAESFAQSLPKTPSAVLGADQTRPSADGKDDEDEWEEF